jgi:electron transport complex protein RnfG
MKEYGRLILVLSIVAFACGAILAVTYEMTREPIRSASEARLFQALRRVVPEVSGTPQPVDVASDDGASVRFFCFPESGAVAFSVRTDQGYGGGIELLVGLDRDGRITGLDVLTHNETPGLGSQILNPSFRNPFVGRSLEGSDWRLTKEGGSVEGISGATISSRAVCDALRRAMTLYSVYRSRIETQNSLREGSNAP